MSNEEKIKRSIREIAGRKQNVTLADIERVMNQLADHFNVSCTQNVHQRLYAVDRMVRFSVCTHRGGSKQIKSIYVTNFLQAMSKIGYYEN